MKVLPLFLVLILITSCASRAPVTYQQKCAERGMVLTGVNSQSGTTSSYNVNYGLTGGNFEGESISCAPPKTEKQKCEVDAYSKSVEPINGYNSRLGAKRFSNALGWLLIMPGLLLMAIYDEERDEAVKKGNIKALEHLKRCESIKK